MKRILLATGVEKIDKALLSALEDDIDLEFIPNGVYFREGVSDSIRRHNPDVLVLSDRLEGSSLSLNELIKLVRKRHRRVRIVFLIKENDKKFYQFLYALGIYDVIVFGNKIDLRELQSSLNRGKKWEDIADFFSDLDPNDRFNINEDEILSNNDEFDTTYEAVELRKKESNFRKQSIFSVWSPRDQSGTTMLTANLALLLSQDPDDKTLVVDWNNDNPNIHLQLSISDEDNNHNMSAIFEDIENSILKNISQLKNYILPHHQYRNIHIISGATLKNPLPDIKITKKAFELIFIFAKKVGYKTVLFDCGSNFNKLTVDILGHSDGIIMPLLDSTGSVISTQKFFDTEFGPFFNNMLDINKVYPVMNKSYHNQNTVKIEKLISSFLSRDIYAKIPYTADIPNHINHGHPLFKQEPDFLLLSEFTKIANCVHNIFELPDPNSKRKGLFSSVFKKNNIKNAP